MQFQLPDAVAILSRTPTVLDALLRDLPSSWTTGTEGPETWSPADVVAHLLHGERTDWMPRVHHLLTHGERVPFTPFDRSAHLTAPPSALPDLLDDFAAARADALRALHGLELSPTHMARTGVHPALGTVTLAELLATWATHDLDHLVQIGRVMGRQYSRAVGPWRAYLRIVRDA